MFETLFSPLVRLPVAPPSDGVEVTLVLNQAPLPPMTSHDAAEDKEGEGTGDPHRV